MNDSGKGPKDLNEFIDEYRKIIEKGYIKTHRSGPTGIGKTLEDLLGIKENDSQAPDFSDYELKSRRINKGNSMLTLITKKPEGIASNNKLLEIFGYEANDGMKELHATLRYGKDFAPHGGRYKMGLKFEDDKLYITKDGVPIPDVFWNLETLENAIKRKYVAEKVVFAGAESKGSGENEEFHFLNAILAKGINGNRIIELVKEGKIVVDIRLGHYRMGPNKGKPHDHGTGLRIAESNQDLLFEDVQCLIGEYTKILKK